MSLLPAVEYVRVSDPKQKGNTSLETQTRDVREWASRLGYEIIKIYRDEAVSGYKKEAAKRPGVIELMRYLKIGDAKAVIFYDETRADRRFSSWVNQVFKPVKGENPMVKFFRVGLEEEWNPWSPEVVLRMITGRQESENKRNKSKDFQKGLLKQEKVQHPGSRPPYGYRYDKETRNLIRVPYEADVVYFIYYVASWGYSSQQISQMLNTLKLIHVKSHTWSASSIDVILTNQTYLGDLYWNLRSLESDLENQGQQMTLFKDVVPAIIPVYLWEIVQSLREIKQQNKRAISTSHLYQGLLVCKKCGIHLRIKDQTPSKPTKKYVYYYCSQCHTRFETTTLDNKILHKFISEWVSTLDKQINVAKLELSTWNKILSTNLEHLELKQLELQHKLKVCDPDTPNYTNWVDLLQNQLFENKHEMDHVKVTIQRISSLLQNDNLSLTINHYRDYAIQEFNDTELRTLMIVLLRSIIISGDGAVTIEYRYTPHVDIHSDMDVLKKRLEGSRLEAQSQKHI
ncbi:recombinase family protein [Alicyclobacillus fastidiosus]|uniref:Recombinase family protein n=1 Tax=Alicyclobacillus fastidiosus TaxID=392011 RepID=A0ABY6ZGQ3_9BACL|nr:recombinase family protein [Alicyclobacillus fastidiosus]WAH42027.1 recombinase family protein [Alicyclobacillus fastidiosus]GMA63775.1 site-specific DNA recombinase [Alicyclobacillus fastidiosus]